MGNEPSSKQVGELSAKRAQQRGRPRPRPKSASQVCDNGIQRLNATIETLEKKDVFLQAKVKQEENKAREMMKKGNKRGAMMCMKKKKMYEKQGTSLQNTLMNLETQKMALDNASANQMVATTMRGTASTMKKVVKDSDLDKVDEIREELQETMGIQDQLNEALTEPLYDDDDESDLLGELEGMMDEDKQKTTSKASKNSGIEETKLGELESLDDLREPTMAKPANSTEKSLEDELAQLELDMG